MNLENLNLVELTQSQVLNVNGGELPYTEHSVNGRAVAKGVMSFIHGVGDFLRGFQDAF